MGWTYRLSIWQDPGMPRTHMHRAAFAVYVLTAALITITGLAVVLAVIQAAGHLGTPAACVGVPASATGTAAAGGPATVGGAQATSSLSGSFNVCALNPSVTQSLYAAAARIAPFVYLAFAAAWATRALNRLSTSPYTPEAAGAVRNWAHVVLLGAVVTVLVQALTRWALVNSILIHHISLADSRQLVGLPWPELFGAAGLYALYASLTGAVRELEGTV